MDRIRRRWVARYNADGLAGLADRRGQEPGPPLSAEQEEAFRQTEYEYLWVLGAVCPEAGHAEGLLSPQLNPKTVNSFRELFSATISEGEHAVMVGGGAGFRRAKALP